MYSNGFLITDEPRYSSANYLGFDNNAWPLDRDLLTISFNNDQLERFDLLTDDINIGDAAIGLISYELAQEYIHACSTFGQKYRLLYIEVIRSDLAINQEWHNTFATSTHFLGYDVGVCAYSYYSSLFIDLIVRPTLLNQNGYFLNQKGLFESINDANLYIQERDSAKRTDPLMFETGRMDIVAIYLVEQK